LSDLKLFRIENGLAVELASSAVALEKHLQTMIEQNMGPLFGVRLLASEYSTGARHGGRMDSLGIDENGSPVIFEYKRSRDENVINQGLFYLDWLLDHRGEFTLLVMQRLGAAAAEEIDWSSPRLVCVARDFTRYDEHAVQQINRTVELVRYRDYDGKLLALELLTAVAGTPVAEPGAGAGLRAANRVQSGPAREKTVTQYLEQAPESLANVFADLDATLNAFGDDVQRTARKDYFAYKRLRNFACVEVHPRDHSLLVYLKVLPDSVDLEDGFTRDVRSIGHFGTGDLEIRIRDRTHLERASDSLLRSYQAS
jgi:predicted transport protein